MVWGAERMIPSALKAIDVLDFAGLVAALPVKPAWWQLNNPARYLNGFVKAYRQLPRRGVDNPLRLAHFLAQGIYETNYLQARGENLNYSAQRLTEVFPRRFPTIEAARPYAHDPEKIANKIYGGRLGNGDEASGDGYRYRGRGFFQLTGKDNYRRYSELAGVNLVADPDILTRDLKTSILVAASYFGKTGLGEYADRNDASAVSRGVNRGDPQSPYMAHGEDKRVEWTKTVAGFLTAPVPAVAAGGDVLELGDRGEAVRALQEQLNALGYAAGVADGIFGRNTRRAVLAFQDEHGLEPTGVVNAETAAAIEEALLDARGARTPEREAATARDLNNAGASDIGQSQQAGAAGGLVGAAAAVGAANEAGLIESGAELAGKVIEDAREGDPGEPAAPAPEETETATATEAPAAPPPEAAPAHEVNWATVMILVGLAVVGIFIFMRARGAVRTRVDSHRTGRGI